MTVRGSLNLLEFALLVGLACGLSLALTPPVRALALRLRCGFSSKGDIPSHIPRMGGVAIALSCVLTVTGMIWLKTVSSEQVKIDFSYWLPVFAGTAIILIGGIIDDCRTLSPRTKFFIQVAGATAAIWSGFKIDEVSVFGGEPIQLRLFAVPLTYLWIIGLTNAYNLVDGLDGLAAGLGAIAAGTCVGLFVVRGDVDDALLLGVLLGALLGFLPYNFNPARIYLGDSGSQLIGYLLAVLAIRGSQKQATVLAVVIPLLIFGLPILDTLLSMARRFLAGFRESFALDLLARYGRAAKRMFEGDRDHIHHRLVGLGFSHRGAVLALYAAAFILSGFAFASVLAQYRNTALILINVGVATVIGLGKLGYGDGRILRAPSLLKWSEHARFDRSFFMGFVDLILIGAAYWGAYLLLYGPPLNSSTRLWCLNAFPVVMLVQMNMIAFCGLYRGVWRAIGASDLIRVYFAVCAGGVIAYSLVVVMNPPPGVFGLFVLDVLALGWLMGAARSAYRIVEFFHQLGGHAARPVLIYGAGLGGQLLLRELRQNDDRGIHPVGFLDDDMKLQRRVINGVPVVGSGRDFDSVLDRYPVDALIISSEKIRGSALRRALLLAKSRGVEVLRSGFQFQPVTLGAEGASDTSQPDVSDVAAHHWWVEAGRQRKLGESLRRTAE